MFMFFSVICFISWIVLPIIACMLFWRTIRKNKPRRKLAKTGIIILAVSLISFVLTLTTMCDHEYEIVEEVTATYETDGKIVKYCPLCEETFEEIVPKLTTEPAATAKPTEPPTTKAPSTTKKPKESYSQVRFDEIYEAYEENEIVAKEKYEGNRYRITATINSINEGTGFFSLTDEGATLTMQKQVGGTIVFFYATFPESQKENLKKVKVGDIVTFDGECYSGNFRKCKLYAINY